MNSKDREALIKKIEKYYREHKGKSLYFYPLATLYYQENEKEKAYQTLLEGLQYYPRYVLALIKIAEILISDKKYEAALAYLETATSIQKYNTKALENLAFVYENLGKYEQASYAYEKILSIDPDNEKAKSKIVELASFVKPDANKIDELLNDVEGSIDSDMENSNRIQDTNEASLAQSSEESSDEHNNVDSAIKIEEVPTIELEDTDSKEAEESEEEVSVTLARLYEKQGYIDDARAIYKKILEKEPDNAEVQQALLELENTEKKNEENS